MSRLYVAFDEHCGLCMQCARWVERVGKGRMVVADSAQHPRHEKLREMPDRLTALVAWDEGTERYLVGFAAVAAIAERLPFGVVGKPVTWVLGKTGWGERIYRKVAAGRKCSVGSEG